MNTNYAAPVETYHADATVPVESWEELLMVWTLRSLNPSKDDFTTISYAIQQNGDRFLVVERVDGFCTSDVTHGFSQTKEFSDRDAALDYWGTLVRETTPPCQQGALPGLVVASANYVETYGYFGGYGSGPCKQSHARIGGWS